MSSSSRISVRSKRRVTVVAGAVAVAALVAACGSAQSSQPAVAPGSGSDASSAPATPIASSTLTPASPSTPAASATAAPAPVSPSAPSTGGAALAACRTAMLRITVDASQAGGSAGSAYYPLNFTNTAATACEMYGYPGVSFAAAASAAGSQIGLAAQRTGAFPKVAVRLAPGGTAHAWVKVSFAGDYPASQCQPVMAGWLRVYPPGETVPGYVSHAFSACSSMDVAQLTVLPVRAGQGFAGVTP